MTTTTALDYPPATATTGLISVNASTGSWVSPGFVQSATVDHQRHGFGFVNSSVIIQGRSLTNASSVKVNNINFPFTNSPTQIVATVPANATTGPIIVTTPGGIFINTNTFVVLLPDVYSFTPTLGPAGTVVTVDGTSFSGVHGVNFNGTSADTGQRRIKPVASRVPSGATSGPITLIVPGGDDVSSNSFTVTSNSTVNLSKTVSPVITGPGTNVTYTLLVQSQT